MGDSENKMKNPKHDTNLIKQGVEENNFLIFKNQIV